MTVRIRRTPVVPQYEEANPFFPHQFETKLKFKSRPRILITQQAYNDMFVIVDEVDKEVGWMGLVEREDDLFIIKEIFLLKQEVDAVATILDRQALMSLNSELLKRDDGLKIANQLRFWGHSHVEMDTFPSIKDDEQLESFRKGASEFFIRGIANKRGKIQFTLFFFDKGVEIEDVPWSLYLEADDASRSKWKKELKEKLKERKYKYTARDWPAPRGGHLSSGPLPDYDDSSLSSGGRFGSNFRDEGVRVFSSDAMDGK